MSFVQRWEILLFTWVSFIANSRSLAMSLSLIAVFLLLFLVCEGCMVLASVECFDTFDRFNPHWANTGLSVEMNCCLSMSSLPQHLGTTWKGKGGFAVSFYVPLWNAASATAQMPTAAVFASCRVSRACSWCQRSKTLHLCAWKIFLVSVS